VIDQLPDPSRVAVNVRTSDPLVSEPEYTFTVTVAASAACEPSAA
jgi:hypothetical protein